MTIEQYKLTPPGGSQWLWDGPEPDWHKDQTPRWDAMVQAGWGFHRPDAIPSRVGLRMVHLDADVRLFTSRSDGREVVHTKLLQMAEAIALAVSLSEGQGDE